jgi:hypothetical protein
MELENWRHFAKCLWEREEQKWISRNGQDHFYRIKVVLPSIEDEIQKTKKVRTLIDLGCGDAFVLGQLLRIRKAGIKKLEEIVLIDRLKKLLEIAKSKLNFSPVITIKADLESETWIPVVSRTKGKRLFLSVFVLQELPDLKRFLSSLSKVFCSGDTGIFVTVAPVFASCLVASRKMKRIIKNGSEGTDFKWAAEYPISNNSRTIYLPYFHRTINDYRKELKQQAFRVVNVRYLSVPETKICRKIFEDTAYGNHIIGHPSSLMLVVKK